MGATPGPRRRDRVASVHATEGAAVGTGVLVDGRHVLTCDWVINRALGRDADPAPPVEEILVGLPFLPTSASQSAHVAAAGWFPGAEDGRGNVAVLELSDAVPAREVPAPLACKPATAGDRFGIVGFPSERLDGTWVQGIIGGPTGPGGWVRLELDDPTASQDQPGYGGAPVWDDDAGALVGMVVAHDPPRGSRTAYMIPVDALERYWPPLRDQAREAPSKAPPRKLPPDDGQASHTRPSAPRLDQVAGYSSDDIGTVDRLGVARDVNTLAALLASHKARPPLSVGLFGAWGSGKTFFMRQLERRIASLAAAAKTAEGGSPPRDSYFCSRVVQITFNAWHYIDSNLWASLVTRVFEGLDEYLSADPDSVGGEYRELLARLETSRVLLRQAEQARDAAGAALERAEERRDNSRDNRDGRTVREVVRHHPELASAADELADTLGLDEALTSLGEIRQATRDLRHLRGRIRRCWRTLGSKSTAWTRGRLVAVLIAAGVLVVFAFAWLFAHGEPVAATVSFVVSVLTGAMALSSALLKRAKEALRAAVQVLEADDPAMVDAQRAVDEEAERVRRLEQDVEALRRIGTSTLYGFISQRYASPDYQQHLGIVALVQRDFQALSELLVGQPGGDQSAVLPKIDRIILYVDDLDRCPPETVVQVLRAVHLLLAFPLFVVVVGVDSRWLERSLRRQYADLLALADEEPDSGEVADYWASTPQNYLEKIFQISYWLPPMDARGYSALIRGMLEEPSIPAGTVSDEPSTAMGEAFLEPPEPGSNPRTSESLLKEPHPRPNGPASQQPEPYPQTSDIDLTPQTLLIRDEERDFIESLAPVISTPRAAKRLINLYRLLKVSLDADMVPLLDGEGGTPGQHRVALLLLAITVGFPGQAVTVLRALRGTGARTWPAFVEELRPQPWNDSSATELRSGVLGTLTTAQSLPWRRLCQAFDDVANWLTITDIDVFVNWLDPVGRYSFGIGRNLRAP